MCCYWKSNYIKNKKYVCVCVHVCLFVFSSFVLLLQRYWCIFSHTYLSIYLLSLLILWILYWYLNIITMIIFTIIIIIITYVLSVYFVIYTPSLMFIKEEKRTRRTKFTLLLSLYNSSSYDIYIFVYNISKIILYYRIIHIISKLKCIMFRNPFLYHSARFIYLTG